MCFQVSDAVIGVTDEFPERCDGAGPQTLKKAHATRQMFVEDVDKAFKRALDAGATAVMPPENMFWADRYGLIVDPFGQPWSLATHISLPRRWTSA